MLTHLHHSSWCGISWGVQFETVTRPPVSHTPDMATAAAFAAAVLAANVSLAPLNLSQLVAAGLDVRAPSAVHLPGIDAVSYAGFFGVNATDHASLFCWYFPALNGNASAPLLVWLQGALLEGRDLVAIPDFSPDRGTILLFVAYRES